jgi:hypothetical protein
MQALSPSVVPLDDEMPAPQERNLPTCPICFDQMVAAEASAFDREGGVSYLWNCETCGCGFVTRHRAQQYACV